MSDTNPSGIQRLAERARTTIDDGRRRADLGAFARGKTSLGDAAPRLAGRSVLVATSGQIAAACVLVELDGVARRIVIAPPDLADRDLAAFLEDGEVDAVATDRPDLLGRDDLDSIVVALPVPALHPTPARAANTEWVLATSGTSGRPKLVAHTLAALTDAIRQAPPGAAPRVWATFYDIRRYGGLQIFLRAIFDGTDLIVSTPDEALGDHLARLAAAGVSSISGTPSHWRRVLMSGQRGAFSPSYIRLSGEIADQMVLDALAEAFPHAAIGHAYASTEAGVGFAVDDGREGFPAALLDAETNGVAMKVEDGTLRLRSARAASRYLGASPALLKDADGFVDSGDLIEVRDGRCRFVGRRGGIINVGGLKVNPEEVEGAINAHPDVRMSLVKARRSPLTGALVVAEVVARDGAAPDAALKAAILELCRQRLPAHKVPALVKFVPALPLTAAGKLSREPVLA